MGDLARIGIWGPTGSGKTTYLAALWHMMQKPRAKYLMTARNADAEEFVDQHAANILKGQFPPPTEGVKPHIYSFEFSKRFVGERILGGSLRLTNDRQVYEVYFVDPRGALILGEEDTVYFDDLTTCDGLMMMIDPGSTNAEYYRAINVLINRLSENPDNIHQTYFAFCLTKMDLHWEQRSSPKRFLKETLGSQFWDQIRNRCPKREFFAISAVGRNKLNDNTYHPNIVKVADSRSAFYRIANLEEWKPVGLFEPLDWLFKNSGAKP